MNAVITPTFNIVGAMIVLPMRSHATSNAAPVAIDAGIRYLLSDPMIILHMCGHTSPTNPMIPVKLTMDAATRETIRRHSSLRWSAFTPSDLALSSPAERTLILCARELSMTDPDRTNISITVSDSQLVLSNDPTCHDYTAARSSGFASSMRTVVMALKIYITAIPHRIIMVDDARLTLEIVIMRNIGMRAKMNALMTME